MTAPAHPLIQGRYVGCTEIAPDAEFYFEVFRVLEYQQSFFYPPRAATLARLRKAAPEGFVFAMRAFQLITHEPGDYLRLPKPPGPDEELKDLGHFRGTAAVKRATDRLLHAAQVLGAVALVFETPPTFTPSAQNRRQMARYFETLPRHNMLLAWEPRGLWGQSEIRAACEDLDLRPVLDPLRDDEENLAAPAYLKDRGLGRQHPLAEHELNHIASLLERVEAAICIFDSPTAVVDAERLAGLLQELDIVDGF